MEGPVEEPRCPRCEAPLMTLRPPIGPPIEVCFYCYAQGKTTWPTPTARTA